MREGRGPGAGDSLWGGGSLGTHALEPGEESSAWRVVTMVRAGRGWGCLRTHSREQSWARGQPGPVKTEVTSWMLEALRSRGLAGEGQGDGMTITSEGQLEPRSPSSGLKLLGAGCPPGPEPGPPGWETVVFWSQLVPAHYISGVPKLELLFRSSMSWC